MAAPVPLKALASKLGVASPDKSPVKIENSSSPPPLVEDTSSILEDGEIDEHQDAADSLRNELQLSTFEYSALEDRFKRLERQHSELKDLASAYSEVIRGFSPVDGQTVSIDQLQAEAGRDGLRAKALEADVLRPLIREAGGLQALISQTHTMRTLIDKAGGLRELEQFVSDLRTIRGTLNELRGSQGLIGLASEVRDLLTSKQTYTDLQSELHGPNGLRTKAARYEKLMQAFVDVQTVTSFQQRNATALTASRATGNVRDLSPNSHSQPARGQQPLAGSAMMNPARARLISATPLESDPDRDLYEAPLPIAKPNNKTGSNSTPLGTPQVQPAAQLANQAERSSNPKRKGPDNAVPSVPAKRPRVDLGRASALVQASLPVANNSSTARAPGPSKFSFIQTGAAAFKTRAQSNRSESAGTVTEDAGSRPQVHTALAPPKMPDWMRGDVRFGDVGFASTPGAQTPTYSSTPLRQDADPHTDTRSGPVRFSTSSSTQHLPFSTRDQGDGSGAQTALQAAAAVPLDPRYNQLSIWKDYLKHPVAFWTGASDATAPWDAFQLYDLKRNFQIPGDLLASFTGGLSKHMPIAKYSAYEMMAPNHNTCILR
ncbi:hypothetical protein BU25DRAFT_445804 [Macroventuria anomochaeta]|uniref:Uncharacterized protein n=1 Tax=Macroventuria anomochaeta TaxID=301207 RepID=A0ACB6SBZ1_9PLEO|nr:uncharacterized protein BU25DRAFT_445804 [Macroventuria anomochaeta]KAF2631726.1 hypothetical protein BU25DRAFT_445804 [Macroventuria anomochaeta]